MSRRLELATGLRVYNPEYRYTAENYHIMNYGLGGKIGLHQDAAPDKVRRYVVTKIDIQFLENFGIFHYH